MQFLRVVASHRVKHGAAAGTLPTIVNFTDPNDLLGYKLTEEFIKDEDQELARTINVIVSNYDTWVGFLERPDYAHCG